MPSPFDDDTAARELLGRLRWPDGPSCPRCAARGADVFRIGGEKHSHRAGLYQCKPCRRQFSVTVGTAFERQRIPLSTWVRAAHAFSSDRYPYYKDKNHKFKLPPLTELKAKIGVSYPTMLHIRDVIVHAARRYRGHKTGFGAFPRSVMKGAGTWLPDYDPRKRKRLAEGKDPSQHTIVSAHILADVMSGHEPREARAAFDRTEVLLRLLLATPPKPASRRRRKKRPATDNSSAPAPLAL